MSYAYINRGGLDVPIYANCTQDKDSGLWFASGTKVGTIYENEMYALAARIDIGHCAQKCTFRNSSGKQATGWVDTSGGYGATAPKYMANQEYYHLLNSNGSTLGGSLVVDINGKKYRQLTVNKAVTAIDSEGKNSKNLPVGYLLATDQSTIGATYNHRMLFQYYKTSASASWTLFYPSGAKTYGFVDLGFDLGSTPSNRAIR